MKTTAILLPAIIALISISCKKEDLSPDITGKWSLIQKETDVRPEWTTINPETGKIVEFGNNGTYVSIDRMGELIDTTTATYHLLENKFLKIEPDTLTAPIEYRFEGAHLILDYPVRCGYLRMKFVAVQ